MESTLFYLQGSLWLRDLIISKREKTLLWFQDSLQLPKDKSFWLVATKWRKLRDKKSQPPPAIVVALFENQGSCAVAGNWPGTQSPSSTVVKSSSPAKKSSSSAISETLKSSSSTSATSSLLLSIFSGGEEGFVGSSELGVSVSACLGRVLPASEFRWVGMGWLCSAV